MELTRAQETQLRRTGREAMEKVMAAAQQATQNGIQRATAKVTAVNGDCTADVDFGTDDYPMPLTGLRYTMGCCSMQVGDRVLVDTVSNQPLITGILANADNGPYVKLLWSGSAAAGTTIAVAGVAEWAIIGATLGGDGATLLGARFPDIGKCQYHCGLTVTGHTNYWASFTVYDETVNVSGVGSQGGAKVSRIYGILKG